MSMATIMQPIMQSDAATPIAPDELTLPEPVGKQIEWLDDDHIYKVLRVGRRGSKTRFAFLASLMGHGPGWDDGTPKFSGVLQGGDVVWICPTYTNLSTVLWREEIEPRMAHLPWIGLNKSLHDVNIPGVGSLMLRSGDREAIKSVRGAGKRLFGVIVDEAAWMDLRGALLDVILPACVDNGAWLILMSTTNAGGDGGYDDVGAPQLPSYFNVVCEQIRAGERDAAEWREFTGTAYDNPTLDRAAIDALVKEYPPDSPKLKQEVFAELLRSGIGLALPHLTREHHTVPPFVVPRHWTQFGGFDWGYNHPWSFGWYACDEDGNVVKIDTLSGREQLPGEIVNVILSAVPAARDGFIIQAGRDIFGEKGRAIGFDGPTIAEVFLQHHMMVVEADNRRVMGLNNLRLYTAIPEARTDPLTLAIVQPRPRFTLMRTDGNLKCLAQMQAMQIDPKNPEDALKVNADYAGRGGDDLYEETRYALMSRPLSAHVDVPDPRDVSDGQTAGFDFTHGRPREKLTGEQYVEEIFGEAQGHPLANKYRVPMRRR